MQALSPCLACAGRGEWSGAELSLAGKFQPSPPWCAKAYNTWAPGGQCLSGTAPASQDTSPPWAWPATFPGSHLQLLLLAQQGLQPLEILLTLHCGEATLCLGSVSSQRLGSASKGLQAWGYLRHLDGQGGGGRQMSPGVGPVPLLATQPQPTPAWRHPAMRLQKGREDQPWQR